MKALFKKNPVFFFLCFLWWTVGGILILNTEKGTWELWVNRHYMPFFNTFFMYFTHIGDGLTFAIVNVFLCFFVYMKDRKNTLKFFIFAFSSFILTGLFTQFIKNFIFPEAVRPSVELAHYFLQPIAGLEWQEYNSFPSGHSTSVFSMAFVLLITFCSNKNNTENQYKIIFFNILFASVAILGAFSRMYLLQHFLVDIYVGSLIGFWGSMGIWVWIKPKLA